MPHNSLPLRFHVIGNWSPGCVNSSAVPSSRLLIPEVEAAIEAAWTHALSRPGVYLFDGPMCRLESWQADADRLCLHLSPTSYKIFLGTNMRHPEFADRFGPRVMANPVGVSTALFTADGYLLLGRRNASLAYYPNRVHPFAGSMEPKDADVFATVRRELAEELSFSDGDIAGIRFTGIAEDISLRQPEAILAVESKRSRAEIESRLDRAEHHSIWSTHATEQGIAAAVANPELTPIAIAALLLWGRPRLGREWFETVESASAPPAFL